MADITKCKDNECDKKNRCYRFTAVSNEYRQAYFIMSPRTDKGCTEFTDNNEEGIPDGQDSSTL